MAADSLTKESCPSTCMLYAKAVKRLYSKSGGFFLALYLKQCANSLQIAYGMEATSRSLTCSGLTRSVFPPSFIRRQMYKKADMRLKILVSLFHLSKIILLAKRVDFSTNCYINSLRYPRFKGTAPYYTRLYLTLASS